jgi:hypothetical protein
MSGPGPGEGEAEFLPSFPTVESFSQAALRQTILCTKHSAHLPGEKDWDYYTTFPGFRRSVPCTMHLVYHAPGAPCSWCTMHLVHHAPGAPCTICTASPSA